MAKPVNSRFFGDGPGRVGIRFHNGTGVVTGNIVKQIGLTRYVVTDGAQNYTVSLAQTTAEATNLTAGLATIMMYADGSDTPAYVKNLRGLRAETTAGTTMFWQDAALTDIGGDPTVSVLISGIFAVNATLSANVTEDSGGAATTTYQWAADGVDIVGATNQTFTLTGAEEGATITVTVTVTTATGSTTVTSPATEVIGPAI